MDILIAVCISIVIGFSIGFAIAWNKQKKRLEKGYNKWIEVKVINQHGIRIIVPVVKAIPIKGTSSYRINAEWQNPTNRKKYFFKKTFLLTDNSPTLIRKLNALESVSVIVYFDGTSQNYWFWMERPW